MIDSLLEGKFGTGMWSRHFFFFSLRTSAFSEKVGPRENKTPLLNARFLHNKMYSEAGPGIQWQISSMHAFVLRPTGASLRILSPE